MSPLLDLELKIMADREVVRIASDRHPTGYYTQWLDLMKPEDRIYAEPESEPLKPNKKRVNKKKVQK